MNLASLAKHKNTIIAVVALVVVCGGSFLGAKALNTGAPTPSQAITTTTAPTTTQATTQPTTIPTTTETTTQPTTLAPTDLITTFPIDTSTSATTTTLPTTTTKVTTTAQSGGSLSGNLDSLLANSGMDTSDKNYALFKNGLASYQYAPGGNYYYTNEDPWQRALGYNELYDAGAQFVAIYIDTMRCKFEYNNMDYMIQFWKGQYGYVFIGHEIGIYNKPKNRNTEHYDAVSDEEAIYMSMTGYRDGEELYTRDYGKYWWCTGFVPGKLDKFSDRSELSLKARMTMKDYSMLSGFVGSLEANGMVRGKDFSTSGLDVYVEW